MIILTLGTMFLLMHRMGMFDEYFRYQETRLLEANIMEAYDDSQWEDRMNQFRQTHPRLAGSPSMSLGRRHC